MVPIKVSNIYALYIKSNNHFNCQTTNIGEGARHCCGMFEHLLPETRHQSLAALSQGASMPLGTAVRLNGDYCSYFQFYNFR